MPDSSQTMTLRILDAAREAGRRVADYQARAARTEIERDLKLDQHDIVTEHDRRCEEIAIAVLRDSFPDAQIVGEEGGTQHAAGRVTFWIDPIDGTSNFVAGMPLFAVSIGAALDGELVAGVVNAPLLGHEFYAARGAGAWRESFDSDDQMRLGGAVRRSPVECLVLTGFPNARDHDRWGQEGTDIARALGPEVMAIRNLGTSALELCFVAAGWADAAYGTSAGPWDIAGGLMIAWEAGCQTRHKPLLGRAADLPWDNPGYAVVGPGRDLPQLWELMDGLDAQAQQIRQGHVATR